MKFLINRGVAILLFCFSALQVQAITMAMHSMPSGLDSRLEASASAARLLRLVSSGLVYLDEDFAPKSKISVISEGENKLIFTLKNVKFQDGSILTASDIARFYNSIIETKVPSPLVGSFADFRKVYAENNKLIIEYKKKTAALWEALQIPILKMSKQEETQPIKNIVGLGAYKVTEFKAGQKLQLTPVDSKMPEILFTLVKDPMVSILKLQKGEVDIIQNDLPIELYSYALAQGLKGFTAPSLSYSYLGFNIEDKVTGNKHVRQALAYAINKQEIIDSLLKGYAKDADSLLSEKHPLYYKAENKTLDLEKANRLLDKAGFPKNAQGIRFRLDFSTTNNPFILRVAQIIQQQLKAVGINMQILSSEWGTFYGNIKKGNFQMYLLTWVGRFQEDIYRSLFHSSMVVPKGANRGRYRSAKADMLIEAVMDKDKKAAAYLQKLLHEEDMVYIPLWKRDHLVLMRPDIEGYTLNEEGDYQGLMNIKK